MKTYVYIDGFNLYFGAVKNTGYRWLDVSKVCALLLPRDQIVLIRYFTARVRPLPHDSQAPVRQAAFLRALGTVPNVVITFGHFLSHSVSMPLAAPATGGPNTVRVIKTEEKGSDVNLATALLSDAYNDRFEQAVLITGDSDLVAPVAIVTNEIRKVVGIINPQRRPCHALQRVASFYRQGIRTGVLSACQFPNTVTDANGTVTKPCSW